MARTLQNILQDSAAYLDLDQTLPTGTELATRTNYANQAVWDASAASQFKEFEAIQITPTYTLASISLASDFREFSTAPRVLDTSGSWNTYEQIDPKDRYSRHANDNYCYVLGNPSIGYTAVFNNLTANATLSIDYQRFPSGLATLSDICELSDPMYVVAKVESFVLQSRTDDRFPQVEAMANVLLKNMIGRNSKTLGGGINTTPKINVANYVLE